jgi:hypothetical protein
MSDANISTDEGLKTMHNSKNTLAWILTLTILGSSLMTPARAALVTTAQVIVPGDANAERERIQGWLTREDVARRLQEYGVKPEDAQARVAALTDEEARALGEKIDTLPAGGDVIGVLFAVFIVLLVTDILGFTKVFPFTRSIK